MLRHLFRSINTVFRTNKAIDWLRKEPISTKNLSQGGVAWSTKKMVLGWELDMKEYHLRFTSKRESKVCATLDAITAAAHQVSLRKWWHHFGLLQTITPAVAGAHGTITCLQHALRQACGRQLPLSTASHNELSTCRQLVQELTNRPMHLCEIDPFHSNWEDAMDASGTGMGGVCQDP